jgi:hypothetical protein
METSQGKGSTERCPKMCIVTVFIKQKHTLLHQWETSKTRNRTMEDTKKNGHNKQAATTTSSHGSESSTAIHNPREVCKEVIDVARPRGVGPTAFFLEPNEGHPDRHRFERLIGFDRSISTWTEPLCCVVSVQTKKSIPVVSFSPSSVPCVGRWIVYGRWRRAQQV